MSAQSLHAQHCEVAPLVLRIVCASSAGARLHVVRTGQAVVPLVDLSIGLARGARIGTAAAQVGFRADVVVVARAVLPAGELVVRDEAMDVFRIRLPPRLVVFDFLVSGALVFLVGAQVVDEDQAMFAFAVLEEIIDAVFLSQP